MDIIKTDLAGVFLVRAGHKADPRGYLVRTNCEESFEKANLETDWVQSSLTSTPQRACLRGMHFQREPHAEIKLVRCVSGVVWDCLVDLRESSPTYRKWLGFELSEENGDAVYIPKGIAHGFVTLTAGVRMLYSMSAPYSEKHASGVRWNDPAIGIDWPIIPRQIAEKDRRWPLCR